jgi:hypothetical protein
LAQRGVHFVRVEALERSRAGDTHLSNVASV